MTNLTPLLEASPIADDPLISDAYSAALIDPACTVDEAVRGFFTGAPPWLDKLMVVRNTLLSKLGFETGDRERGELPERFEPGQQFGPFAVLERTDEEIVLGGDDQRFSLRISVWIPPESATLTITTAAEPRDLVGRIYLCLVKPGHRLLAPMMTRRAARAVSASP